MQGLKENHRKTREKPSSRNRQKNLHLFRQKTVVTPIYHRREYECELSIQLNPPFKMKDILDPTITSLSIAIMVANFIALAVFLKRSFLVKKSTYLLMNLTIADFLVGVSCCILGSGDVNLVRSSEKFSFARTELIFAIVFISASITSLSVIAVERVFAVFWPFHLRLAKRWHYFTAIGFTWLLSAINSALVARTVIDSNPSSEALVIFIFPSLSLLTILLSYISIWIKLKFFTKFRRCRTIQENSKLTKTLFIVTLVSLGTWLPVIIMLAAQRSSGLVFLFSNICVLCNSFFNVFVYLWRMPEFRNELKRMFCKC